jgi:hypothetical protein
VGYYAAVARGPSPACRDGERRCRCSRFMAERSLDNELLIICLLKVGPLVGPSADVRCDVHGGGGRGYEKERRGRLDSPRAPRGALTPAH